MARKKKQKRVASRSGNPVSRVSQKTNDFAPDYSYVIKDLKRIGILAGTFITLLVLLSFILN